MKNKRKQAELSILIVALIWGTSFVIVKSVLTSISPFTFLGVRFILAFITLLLFSYNNIRFIRPSTVYYGCLLGLFLVIGYVCQTIGLKYTSATNAGFITSLSVVLVPVIHGLIGGPLPNIKTILCLLTALAGSALLLFHSSIQAFNYGDLLILLCSFGFALHLVFVGIYSHLHNTIAITGIQLLFVGIVCLIFALLFESWPHYFSYTTILSILATSFLATSLAFLTQNMLQRYSTPTRFAIILTTEPVFAAIAAYIWLQEKLSLSGYIGAGLILVSMLVSIATRSREPIIEANV